MHQCQLIRAGLANGRLAFSDLLDIAQRPDTDPLVKNFCHQMWVDCQQRSIEEDVDLDDDLDEALDPDTARALAMAGLYSSGYGEEGIEDAANLSSPESSPDHLTHARAAAMMRARERGVAMGESELQRSMMRQRHPNAMAMKKLAEEAAARRAIEQSEVFPPCKHFEFEFVTKV